MRYIIVRRVRSIRIVLSAQSLQKKFKLIMKKNRCKYMHKPPSVIQCVLKKLKLCSLSNNTQNILLSQKLNFRSSHTAYIAKANITTSSAHNTKLQENNVHNDYKHIKVEAS